MIKLFVLLFLFFYSSLSFAQYTHADTLRGSNGFGRARWDVLKYDISINSDFDTKNISGKNKITFYDSGVSIMQIDLQQPMIIDSVMNETNVLKFRRDGNVCWIEFRDSSRRYKIKPGARSLTIYYHGKPKIAIRPPWDGGMIWTKDKNSNPWISIACQGLGASVWYPCKDYQGDEPDYGASLSVTVPDTLTAVGNGRLKSTQKNNDRTTTYNWEVKDPINNYDIIPYIGKYVNFNEVYNGEKGNLEMNYWVLDYNLEKAKKQFADATKMMKAFEYWFGPYPFYEDGYKLVEAPHLGMEHQSAIAYGNKYVNGYSGRDMSGSGWGLKWDYIIVHESGHEWFGNNITTKDISDMWIHEGFTDYAETLFTEYYYGKQAANEYVIGLRKRINNDIPIIGPYGVNKVGSGDMYFKGANVLHTIRQIINDDEKFRMILRGLNKTFYHQTVTSKQVEEYMSKNSGIDLSKIFDQYLRTTMIPTLEYKIENGKLFYRWANCIKGFNMPVKIMLSKDQYSFIYPTEIFKQIKTNDRDIKVDDNFYIKTEKL